MSRFSPVNVRADARTKAMEQRAQPDRLDLWALSLGFAAVLIAAVPYATVGDDAGAAFVVAGAAAIIALMLRASGKTPRS